jgi:hypothetical protein
VNDFAPYITIWHQDVDKSWTIYYDAPRPDIACPRYYGPATRSVQPASIVLRWNGPAELTVQMESPRLDWTVRMQEPIVLRVLNLASRSLPFWTWQRELLLRPRELIAGLLGLGRIRLAGVMPSGHFGVLMPQEIFFVDRSHAELRGRDLGNPARVTPNPAIGDVPLPAKGIFAIGQAHWEIRNPEEYAKTRLELGR